jgi:hypothetical protein
MTHDIEQWFSDVHCGADWQDMDLVLANVEYLPRLKALLARHDVPEFKKTVAVSAVLELLEHDCPPGGGPQIDRLTEDLRATIRRHEDAARAAMPELGPVKEVVLLRILGLPIPADYPQWIIDQAREEGG